MRPDEDNRNGRVGTPQVPQRSFMHTPPSRGGDPQDRQQEAAANLIRSRLDQIYAAGTSSEPSNAPSNTTTPTSPEVTTSQEQSQDTTISQQNIDVNPYERTLSTHRSIQADQWRHYHSAWQEYYKKYYEGYYAHHIQQVKQSLEANQAKSEQPAIFGSAASDTENEPVNRKKGALTRNEAVEELRQKLIGKVQASAQKARKSRHFVPAIVSLAVVFVFLFLQYNQILIANVRAYVTPGSIDPQNIIVDPNAAVSVGPEPRLIIPKINVDTPVVYGVGADHNSQMKAMERGVAHFSIAGANSRPGEIGNTVLSGHSSGDVFAPGDYNFIFMQLDKLEIGDTIYANYEGTRYTYTVTKKEVVLPSQVDKLIYDTDKPVMTLITCTPLGTALKRLLVTAEQVHPSPSSAKPAPSESASNADSTGIPGQSSPTLLERLFGR